MMSRFFLSNKTEIINSLIVFFAFIIIQLIIKIVLRTIGKSKSILIGRTKLVVRYFTATLLFVTLLIIAFIFGVNIEEIVVIFSSVFAFLGIALFASWSILSNVTSGIVMFFSFPYKIGDKIKIHDNDLNTEAIIEDIRSFQIHLRLSNGNLVTYPNSLMLQKAVTLVEKDAL